MPWREVSAMEQRREFVRLAMMEDANRRDLCRRFGISPETSDRSGKSRPGSPNNDSSPTGVLSLPARIRNALEKRVSTYASSTVALPLPNSGVSRKSKYFATRP